MGTKRARGDEGGRWRYKPLPPPPLVGGRGGKRLSMGLWGYTVTPKTGVLGTAGEISTCCPVLSQGDGGWRCRKHLARNASLSGAQQTGSQYYNLDRDGPGVM